MLIIYDYSTYIVTKIVDILILICHDVVRTLKQNQILREVIRGSITAAPRNHFLREAGVEVLQYERSGSCTYQSRRYSMTIVAITSTTILPLDGTYEVKRLESTPDITGIPHYIGHPATKDVVEAKGAVQAPSKLFTGLQAGESQLCFAIKQGQSDRSQGGTAVNQDVSEDMLDVRIVTRLA